MSKSPLGLDHDEAGYVSSILQIMVTCARFVNIFLSFKVNTVVNLYFNYIVMIAGCITMMLYIDTNLFAVKIGIALLGLGYGSTYPLLITFVEQRITLTNRISSVMAFSSVFVLCISPFIVGNYIDAHPVSFVYITLAVAILALSFFTFLHVMEVFRRRKI